MSSVARDRKLFASPGLEKAILRLGFLSSNELEKLASEAGSMKLLAAIAQYKGISEISVLTALGRDLRVDVVELRANKTIEQIRKSGLLNLVEERFLLEHSCLPLERREDSVDVAFADPLDLETIAQLEFALGSKVIPKLSSETQIRHTLTRLFGLQHAETLDAAVLSPLINAGTETVLDETVPVDGLSEEAGSATAPVVKFVNQILLDAHLAHASDVHLEPNSGSLEVRFRVDGLMTSQLSIPKRLQSYVSTRLKILAGMDITEKRRPQDGRFRMKGPKGETLDIRGSTVPTPFGEKIVLRLLRSEIDELNLQALEMPADVQQRLNDILRTRDRILLVCGPTGSGKTTTLYSALNSVREATTNIVTVEDPIEIRLDGITQIQVDQKIGVTFASGLRSILRQDPDIILVGEIRDLETAQIAFQAAQTGHFVLSTLHTNTAVSAVIRLGDLGLEPFIIASALGGVLAQRLLRKVCPHCIQVDETDVSIQSARRFRISPVGLRRGGGCDVCEHTGFKGRIAAYSLLTVNTTLRELIRMRASEEQIRQAARVNGLQDLFEAGLALAAKGLTTIDEVERVIGLSEFIDQSGQVPIRTGDPLSREEKKEKVSSPKREEEDLVALSASEKGSIEALAEEHRIGMASKRTQSAARVLLVDDDDGVRAVLNRILKKADFEVCEAANGYEALEKISSFSPDIVISDLVMPGMDGRELVAELKQSAETAKIPVLMLTGSDDERNEIELISLGANDFVSKTSSPALVLTRVKRLLGS